MSHPFAKQIMRRIDALAQITDEPGRLTRTFGSPAMRQANDLVAQWMKEAGMTVREDAIGNIIGHYAASADEAGNPHSAPPKKCLLIGSHLDTVRDAGKFDGPLGVILAIACVERLHQMKSRLPFAVEVIGFSDEEGVRFQSTYLGSRALVGTLTKEDLGRKDASGISVAEAIKSFGGKSDQLKSAQLNPKNLLGYLEVHIEQGPILEKEKLPLSIVTAIAGQTRLKFMFTGKAGHAGTTPMSLRQDALCAASEFILAVETFAKKQKGLVATVGQISAQPGASNVIPGEVALTLDVRHQNDPARRKTTLHFIKAARQIAARRNVKASSQIVQETNSVPCSKPHSHLLKAALKKHQRKVIELPSGAGHDAAMMAQITPAAMLFVRCKGGISHHPDESVKIEDAEAAFHVVNDFLQLLANGNC